MFLKYVGSMYTSIIYVRLMLFNTNLFYIISDRIYYSGTCVYFIERKTTKPGI